MSASKIKVALIGYGVVGQGFATLAAQRDDISIEVICVKDAGKKRDEKFNFVHNIHELWECDFDVLVEATDAEFETVKNWYLQSKDLQLPFVTANKQFVAHYLAKYELDQDDRGLLYEASVTAAIPIIRSLQTCFTQGITQIEGILNGSTNYILSDVFKNGSTIEQAITTAQLKGYAESNPSLDLNGSDPAAKLSILIRNAFGVCIAPGEIPVFGLNHVNEADIELARSLNCEIRFIAHASIENEQLTAWVAPVLVANESVWASIQAAENAILVTDTSGEPYLFKGNGAGGRATGTALLNDVLAQRSGFGYQYFEKRKLIPVKDVNHTIWLRSHKTKAVIDPLRVHVIESRLEGQWCHNQFHASISALNNVYSALEQEHGVLFASA